MRWLRQLFARSRHYEYLSESIREHLDEKIADLMDRGMTREEAERKARREFGNVTQIEERGREVWQWPTLESALADIRFALRQLVKSPGFTMTAVLTLALGIAVNATMFSLVSAFLLPHLPGRAPEHIIVASSVNPNTQFQPDTNAVSPPNYLAWKSDTRIFSDMAAEQGYRTGSLSEPGHQPESISYASVSPNYFSLFGVLPVIGRDFLPNEDQPGRDHVLLLSHSLWSRRFGSDLSVVGRTVRLDREDYLVIGVMPENFRLLGFVPQVWTPLTLTAADRTSDARKNRSLVLFARLAAGVTLEQARAQLHFFAKQDQKDFPEVEKRWGASAHTLGDFLVDAFGVRPAVSVMMAMVAFVLLIACANVAGLLVTRAIGRQKELAIRVSLGATRGRVVRQLLTEGIVIALFGGAFGLFLAIFGIRVLDAGLGFNEYIATIPVTLDTKVLIFAIAVSLFSAILSSVAPALKASRTEINTYLKSENRGATSSRSRNRMRVVLVGGEIAMALFLLIGAGLLIRAIYTLEHQKLGFSHDHLLTAGLVLDKARYPDPARQEQFAHDLISQLREIPGINGTAVVSNLPGTGAGSVPIHIKGQPEPGSSGAHTALEVVATSDYFEISGIPLLRGRTFTDGDDANRPHVVIVSQEFVHKYLQDRDPIGQQIRLDISGAPVWCEIIGEVAGVRTYSEDPRIEPTVYELWAQHPVPAFSLMLRSNMEPDGLVPSLRHVVAMLDSELPLLRVMSMDQVIDGGRNGNPLFAALLGTFAFLALILSAIGVYGLIAYSVGQRTQEIGIRMALGAKRAHISRMILGEGIKVATIGSAIGVTAALPLPRVFDSIFQGDVEFAAPVVYPSVLVLMLAVALVAMFVPARRATQIDPTQALRNE